MTVNYDELDPGIREIVRRVNQAGFETTDSGDGVSKPAAWYESGEAIPFPHLVATTTAADMVADACRLSAVLGDGWTVEAEYQTNTQSAHLFARTLDPREVEGVELMTETKDTPERKHRATCASRLVVFSDEAPDGVSCGLPCDCDNPQPWVEVPIAPTPEPGPVRIDLPKPKVQGFDKMFQRIENEIVRPTPEPSVTTDPPGPTQAQIDRLEKAAWDSHTDGVLVWYRDQIQHLRDRMREADRAMKLDRQRAIRAESAFAAQAQEIADLTAARDEAHAIIARYGFGKAAHEIKTLQQVSKSNFDACESARDQRDSLQRELDQVRSRLTAVEQESERKDQILGEIVGLSFGFDEDGSLGPRPPLSWETVARVALDLARGALTPTSPQTPEDRK
ncbi:MAG TPA: hypothetical protein VF491_17665 [Vicinamibacterales bacterium]